MSTAKKNTSGRRPKRAGRKPLILVLEGLHGATNVVRRAGGDAVQVSPRNIDEVERALSRPFDGLLLTGGGDVDPRLYGAKPHKQVYGVSETRDFTELVALDEAYDRGVPVLGICRGSQLMAVHNGGKLRQHMTGHRGGSHVVFGESGSRFRRVIGGERGVFVSLHHQVVLRHGDGFRVAARDKDGNIEAIESRDGRSLGVQFHPEMDYGTNECSRRIFDWLVGESARRAGLAKPTRVPFRRAVPAPRKTYAPALDLRTAQRLDLLIEAAKRGNGRRTSRTPTTTRWFCRDCGLEFDKQQDRDDHEYWICGDPAIRVTEPPPGHPDWS